MIQDTADTNIGGILGETFWLPEYICIKYNHTVCILIAVVNTDFSVLLQITTAHKVSRTTFFYFISTNNLHTPCTMTSRWSKRRKIKSMVRATESEILQQFQKTFTDPNMQGHSVAELEHVKCPSVALESGVSVSSHSVVDQPGIGEHEQRSAFSETHVSLDSVHDCPSARPVDSESDDADAEAPTSELVTSLRFWASSFSVSLAALTALLSILRVFHPELPRDARTILKTQGEIKTKKMEGGEYYHFGLATGLMSKLNSLKLPASLTTIKLQFSIDGLPLFRSSRTQFWPILATINADYSKSPFLVGLFCGFTKPKSVFEFLGPFIEDLSCILKNGICYNGQQIMAEVCSFICDAPARAFIKNVKSHNGYSGCGKCFQVGEWHNKRSGNQC